MRILEIRDIAVPMGAPMRNAVIDFSKMTVSAVAVVTDAVRGGAPVVGFGFNANGRYAQSALIRERLAPRVLEAPESHASADGTTLDPRAIHRLMMRNEKPGGHGERAVAVAALDIAVWDATAKLRDMPLWALIAEDAGNLLRFGGMRPGLDFVQFDPALAYGVGETIDIVAMMAAEGWSARRFLPHGGNLLALATAGGLSLGGCESYPGVFQPFGGFADDTPVEDGYVRLGDAPGAGFERKAALHDLLRTLL